MPRRRPRFTKERPPDPDAIETDWRLFIAVPLPKDVVEQIASLIAAFEPAGWPIRWVDPRAAHITLRFIGNTPPERAELLRLALPRAVAAHEGFRLRTSDLGVFPNQRRPRVLWLGLYGPAHRLESLHEGVTNLLTELEFPVDEQPFHPHITLGRVRESSGVSLRALPEEIKRRYAELAEVGLASANAPRFVPIDEVHLVRSILGREGARYETLEVYPLERGTSV